MTAAAMIAEFGDVAGWTADAVERLGSRHAIPAACRGSSNPAALTWLAEACHLSSGDRLLDVGAGAGGPAAWAARRYGVHPILVEPMLPAARAAVRLFGLPVVSAVGGRLPLRTSSVDAAWCLGVLCTVEDKTALLREIHRVLRAGGPLGLLVVVVVVAREELSHPVPDGNHFPTQEDLVRLLDEAGFEIVGQIDRPSGVPRSWARRVERVAEVVAAEHRTNPMFALAADQGERLSRLLADKQLSVQLVHAVRRSVRERGDGFSATVQS